MNEEAAQEFLEAHRRRVRAGGGILLVAFVIVVVVLLSLDFRLTFPVIGNPGLGGKPIIVGAPPTSKRERNPWRT